MTDQMHYLRPVSSTLIQIIVNEAMRLEREQHLGAGHYEQTPERQSYANGYKPKPEAPPEDYPA